MELINLLETTPVNRVAKEDVPQMVQIIIATEAKGKNNFKLSANLRKEVIDDTVGIYQLGAKVTLLTTGNVTGATKEVAKNGSIQDKTLVNKLIGLYGVDNNIDLLVYENNELIELLKDKIKADKYFILSNSLESVNETLENYKTQAAIDKVISEVKANTGNAVVEQITNEVNEQLPEETLVEIRATEEETIEDIAF